MFCQLRTLKKNTKSESIKKKKRKEKRGKEHVTYFLLSLLKEKTLNIKKRVGEGYNSKIDDSLKKNACNVL